MVRRLIQQQNVGAFQQSFAQRHTTTFTTRKLGHVGIAGWQAHRVHRDLNCPVQFPGIGRVDPVLNLGLFIQQLIHFVVADRLAKTGIDLVKPLEQLADRSHGFLDIPTYVERFVERWLLRNKSNPSPVCRLGHARKIFVNTCHNPQEGRLAGPVHPQNSDLGSRIKRDPDILQDLFLVGNFAELFNLEDVLWRHGLLIRSRTSVGRSCPHVRFNGNVESSFSTEPTSGTFIR